MEKIKSVKFNSYILTKEFHKWEFENRISFSEEFIRDNEHIFQIEYEDENFEMKIPELNVLRNGYYVYSEEPLIRGYKTSNWYATEEQAKKELELRETKMFINKLIEWSDETSMIGYNETYIKNSSQYGIYYCDGIIKSYCLHSCKYDFRIYLKSYESANLFIKQINLPENTKHRNNLIEIFKSGRL